MANQWPTPSAWTDGDHTLQKRVSLPVFSAPIPGVKAKYSFTQDTQCFLQGYSPAAVGSAHPSAGATPDYSSYVLCEESQHRDLTGGVVRFTRTYAVPPQSWDDWETYAYTLIAFTDPTTLATIRARRTANLQCRVRRDYFLFTGSNGSVSITLQDGSSYSATTVDLPGSITITKATQYGAARAGIFNVTFPADTLNGTTLPTYANYLAQATDAATNKWAATIYAQTIANDGALTESNHGGQLIAEDSKFVRWMGNIWCRETRYVLAQ